jgi:hypothetical protein
MIDQEADFKNIHVQIPIPSLEELLVRHLRLSQPTTQQRLTGCYLRAAHDSVIWHHSGAQYSEMIWYYVRSTKPITILPEEEVRGKSNITKHYYILTAELKISTTWYSSRIFYTRVTQSDRECDVMHMGAICAAMYPARRM